VESLIGDPSGSGTSGIGTVDVPGLRPVGAIPVFVGGILPSVCRSRWRRVGGRQGGGVGRPLGGSGARHVRGCRIRVLA